MQYTEEHYAQMYNDLPEGLKELVLSGRLAIMVSAIGSRHGLNTDQVADLEPAIEDVCLGLITKDELVDNIVKNVNVDQRVANRIAAEAELEILKPFDAELLIARKQKEDLDEKIQRAGGIKKPQVQVSQPKQTPEPKDISDHATEKKVADWYGKSETEKEPTKTFDWEKSLGKNEEIKEDTKDETKSQAQPNIEDKLDQLTESINKLVSSRFGGGDKKEEGLSSEMQELVKRLEKAERENEENKKLIKSLQTQKISTPTEILFGEIAQQNKVQIDKERKVEIAKDEARGTGNIQITSVSKNIPIENKLVEIKIPATEPKQEIISSSVSKDTLDSIFEIRNKTPQTNSQSTQTSTKKVLSLDELVAKGDSKIKEGLKETPANKTAQTGTLVFPGANDEKKVDIKNVSQKDSMRKTLLDDLEFLKNTSKTSTEQKTVEEKSEENDTNPIQLTSASEEVHPTQNTSEPISSTTTNLFKEELLPKTKEERMQALQEKIKALNKGVSIGGKTNISASSFDPYKI